MHIERVLGPENKTYYHGSMEYLPVGEILTPRRNYQKNWGHTDFYKILEKYRPSGVLSHREAVFMVGRDEDIDLAGGGTEYVFKVLPLGNIQKHDMNWSSEISALRSDGYEEDDKRIIEAANNYWGGKPHYNESVWEYLTPRAKILHVERY